MHHLMLPYLKSVGNVHNSAAISHTDVRHDQYLWVDGMFKVSKFKTEIIFLLFVYCNREGKSLVIDAFFS